MPRHSSVPAGRRSRPTNTVDPVVVIADIASNIASVKLACGAPSQNGSAPNAGNTTQMPVVSRNPCCRPIAVCPRPEQERLISAPTTTVRIAVVAKTWALRFPWRRSASIGSAIDAPSAVTSQPIR